jgi:hypothetical protein
VLEFLAESDMGREIGVRGGEDNAKAEEDGSSSGDE